MAHLALTAGPDAGRIVDLATLNTAGHGVATLGRRGAVAVDDPALEVVHAHLDTTSGMASPLGGEVHLTRGGDRRIGATTLRVVDRPLLIPRVGSRIVERPVRTRHDEPEVEEEESFESRPAHPRPGAGPPIAAAMGLTASAVIALVTGNPMFLLFGSIGAVTALGTSAVELVRSRRAGRRRAREEARHRAVAIGRALESYRTRALALRETWPLDLIDVSRSTRVWERRRDHGDLLRVVVGLEADDHPGVAHLDSEASDVPLSIDLADMTVVAVIARDPVAAAVLRSIACQLAVAAGPADVLIDIGHPQSIPLDPPHRVGPVGRRHRIVIGGDVAELGDPTSTLRGLLDADAAVTVVTTIPPGHPVPAGVQAILEVADDWSGNWVPDASRPGVSRALTSTIGASVRTTRRVSRELAHLIDPELGASTREPPRSVALARVLEGWRPDSGSDNGDRLEAVLGCGVDGEPIVIDLASDGPHVLLAGTTGAGKSELLRALVVSAATRQPPERLNIALIDFKGGAAFDSLAHLPHVASTLTDLDEHTMERALIGLEAELRYRERALRETRPDGAPPFPRLLIVIDEFAELVAAAPAASRAVLGIARRGRGLGVHLIIATQRPAGVVNDEIRSNTDVRICLRVNGSTDSRDVIGNDSAAQIDRSVPGRGILHIVGREHRAFQGALVSPDDLEAAGRRAPAVAVRRPWQPDLPDRLEPGSGRDGRDLGVIDRPEAQSTESLRWDPDAGGLVISGDPGSGRTTALRTVVASIDRPTHLVVDRHDGVLDRIGTHVGPVIRADDTERVQRLIRRLDDALRERRGGAPGTAVTLAVDGIDRLIATLDGLGDDESVDRLRSVIADGPSVGISTVATTRTLHRLADLPVTHWLLHRGDPGPAQQLGAPTALLPARVPGRALRLPDPAVIQVRLPPEHPIIALSPAPESVTVLPLSTAGRGPTGAEVHGGVRLELGIASEDLAPFDVTLLGGRHLLVIGGRRSGRTGTLEWIARSWSAITGRPAIRVDRSLDEAHGAAPGLVVVDDALRVDAGGSADRLLGDPEVVVVAAVDGDGLRGAWGHWLGDLRRWRTGIVMASGAALDGDLLGTALPTRTPIAPRPGLGWWVADGRRDLLQLHEGGNDRVLHPDPTLPDDMLAPWRTRTVPPSQHSTSSGSTTTSLW